jgi:glycosyltransferase involved in cell wall biosynthesis
MKELPLITVGIPIYYGEVHIEDTLSNILKQDYKNLEIIIADNNPGGKPEEVATRYSEKFGHITYVRHEKNRGALENWNSLIGLAGGDYFIYAGAHDLWSDHFLSSLVDKLNENPEAVVAYAPSFWMEEPLDMSRISTGFFDTSGSNLIQRFNTVFWGPEEPLYGLFRLSTVRKTRLQPQIIGSGAVWLAELSLYGHFVVATNIRRFRRKNRESENRHERLKRYHYTLFKKRKKYWLPYWKFYLYYLSVPFRGRVGFLKRLKLLSMICMGFLIRYGSDMILDMASTGKRIFKGY